MQKGKLNLEQAADRARTTSAAQKLRKAREYLQAIENEDMNDHDPERPQRS